MTEPAPKKKLKQSSIIDALKKQRSVSTIEPTASGSGLLANVAEADSRKRALTPDIMSAANKDGSTCQRVDRNTLAAAAEKRRNVGKNDKDPDTDQGTLEERSPELTGDEADTSDTITAGTSRTMTRTSPPETSSMSCRQVDESPPKTAESSDAKPETVAAAVKAEASAANALHQAGQGSSPPKLRSAPPCCVSLGELRHSPSHTVLSGPQPKYVDKWDADNVKMPFSSKSMYPVETHDGKKTLKNRWELIETALLANLSSSFDLEEAILSYNARYCQKWDFKGLHVFFTEILESTESNFFFQDTLPKMVQLALRLPELCKQPIPLLTKGKDHRITLSQEQCASLLANAFFCTFPRRNTNQRKSEYSSYPDINFSQLFIGSKTGINHRKAEKLKCILHYFTRVTKNMPSGNVTFHRQVLSHFPAWQVSAEPFPALHVTAEGNIEDDGQGMLQVDFANKFLGGGVLGHGCVQEEIRFLVCPEMILSRLFTEVLDKNECLIMTGCERFSCYSGYSDSFAWVSDYQDKTPRDSWQRLYTAVVAIDALHLRGFADQFQQGLVTRELNKAYCGFLARDVPVEKTPAVATGNWGCGAFGGDFLLKALIQLMAAAEAHREVRYFTFGDTDLVKQIRDMHKFITTKRLSVSDAWSLIQQYGEKLANGGRKAGRSSQQLGDLFQFIYGVYAKYDADTDTTEEEEEGGDGDDGAGGEEWGAACGEEELSLEVASHWERASPDYAASTP